MSEMMEQLNAEILYWKRETDKRKVQLGEYLLDEPCEPDNSLWERYVAHEVEEAREKLANDPGLAMALIMALVRDKHECMVSFNRVSISVEFLLNKSLCFHRCVSNLVMELLPAS
jgi:hypothetical protein